MYRPNTGEERSDLLDAVIDGHPNVISVVTGYQYTLLAALPYIGAGRYMLESRDGLLLFINNTKELLDWYRLAPQEAEENE